MLRAAADHLETAGAEIEEAKAKVESIAANP